MVPPAFRVGHSSQLDLSGNASIEALQCISVAILNVIKLTVKMNHHNWSLNVFFLNLAR